MTPIRGAGLAYAAAVGVLPLLLSSASAAEGHLRTTTQSERDITTTAELGPSSPERAYGFATFTQEDASVPLEFGALFAGITYIGVKNWNWGNAGFRFHPEHWFGKSTGSGGTDKLGHFYTTYVMSDLL